MRNNCHCLPAARTCRLAQSAAAPTPPPKKKDESAKKEDPAAVKKDASKKEETGPVKGTTQPKTPAPVKKDESAKGRTAAAGTDSKTATAQGARPGIGKFTFEEPDKPSAGAFNGRR